MTDTCARYEPRYYERSAQRYVLCLLGEPIFINVPWGLSGNLPSRPEIDAVAVLDSRVVPIEIKAYWLDLDDLDKVRVKYRELGFIRLILVAPAVSAAVFHSIATDRTWPVELIIFHPELAEIEHWYDNVWPKYVPAWVHTALATGYHHVRFVLSAPTSAGRFVIGQQRSRIYDVDTISHLLRRLPSPPVRILWTPVRFTIPRDVIACRSRLTALGGFVPLDIDGDRLHRAFHACELSVDSGVCQFCLRYAEREKARLLKLVKIAPVDVLASGGRGLHVYYHDEESIRRDILDLARRRIIRFDDNVTASIKATVALPGSLHAGSNQPVISQTCSGNV